MLKNISNLGSVLNKSEQKFINGGDNSKQEELNCNDLDGPEYQCCIESSRCL